MTFSVTPDALDWYARRLGEAGTDAEVGKDYITKHASFDLPTQGLLNKAWPAHQALVDEVTGRMAWLVELLDKSRTALERNVAYYRRTDADSAARLDATVPYMPRGDEEMADVPVED